MVIFVPEPDFASTIYKSYNTKKNINIKTHCRGTIREIRGLIEY